MHASRLLLAMFCAATAISAGAQSMKLADYMALSGPAPSATLAYGAAPSQFAELFVPPGSGPFPVAVLVHGGCWTRQFGGITQMRNMAGALTAHGIAVWNVEYRRVDEAGGGYPGTYQDINAALDLLAAQSAASKLDMARVVAVGHSAGGQLVQWLAGRARIAPASPLYQAQPVPVREIISLGGLADLRAEQVLIKTSCERAIVDLTGLPSTARPDVFADTNAADLVPNGSHTVLITGALDHVSPPRVAHDYAARARRAGDRVDVVIVPGASHYDEVAATSAAWPAVRDAIMQALHVKPAALSN